MRRPTRRLDSYLSLVALWLTLIRTASAAPAKQAIVISWDGAANWVVDRLLSEGQLPNVARLAKLGVRADYCIPAFPSKTDSGHAALMTGAFGDVNGITGNAVPLLPRAGHTLLEYRSGLDPAALLAESISAAAVRAGKKVVSLSMMHTSPTGPGSPPPHAERVPPDRFLLFNGFGPSIEREKVWDGQELHPAQGWLPLPPHRGAAREFSFTMGDSPFYALVYDDPRDPTSGADTLLIRQGSKEAVTAVAAATLKAAEARDDLTHFSRYFRVTRRDQLGYAYFRLFSLAPDGQMMLYQRAVNAVGGDAPPAALTRYWNAVGGSFTAPFESYDKGTFGPPLWQSGDGIAERRLLECIRLDNELLRRATRYALAHHHPDLLFHYVPITDGAGHEWMGALDPDSPCYDPALARRLWPYYAATYRLQDEGLGDILNHMDKETVVCLVSDHGMAGITKIFSCNGVLEKARLLARTADNQIDLSRTKICSPPGGGYFFNVNGTDWKGGIVTLAQRESVLRAATEALLSTVDPEARQHVVTRVFRPEETVGLGMGGPAGGDLYFDVAPGYEPASGLASEAVWKWPSPIGGGAHGYFPLRSKMQAICYMGGAGVRRGRRLHQMQQIDFAPTVARLLGIPAPRDTRGHVLEEALHRAGQG